MNFSVCVYMFAVINWVIGQRYKAILVPHNTVLNQFDITAASNQLVFEFKGCTHASVIFRDKWGSWRYSVNFDASITGKANLTLITRTSSYVSLPLVSGLYTHGEDCNTFIKVKIGWKDGIFAVWSYHVTGWNKFLTWNHTLPVLGFINSLHTHSANGFQWKIYVLDHSTSPYRVSCINF